MEQEPFMKRVGPLLLSLLLAAPVASTALAQEFPSRPVSIVVPFPPGGSVDSVARVLAAELAETTGKVFVALTKSGRRRPMAIRCCSMPRSMS